MNIRTIAVDDDLKALLSANDLPIGDVDDPTIRFYGAFDGTRLVGVVGIQALDGAVLLRSLAVTSDHRARGLGRQLCEHAMGDAREVWLLTTSARDYFARHGFEPIDRSSAPQAIQRTRQFSELCPSSATVMRRRL